MRCYRVGGLVVQSALPLLELRQVPAQVADWTFAVVDAPPPAAGEPFHEIATPDGVLWLALIRAEDGYVLRFPDLATFHLDVARRLVSCHSEADVDDDTLRHLLIDQVVPYLLAHGGETVLHGSAVALAGGVLAFVGPSGAGKSTLAASFALDGFPLVADDFLLVEPDGDRFVATPAYEGVRLWPDSVEALTPEHVSVSRPVAQYTDKRRLTPAPGTTPDRRQRLAAVAVIDEEPGEPGIRVEPMGARDAFLALFQAAFRLERSGSARQATEFDRFLALARSTPVLRLTYERDFDLLPAVRKELLARVADLA
jgi:hypothetical protein